MDVRFPTETLPPSVRNFVEEVATSLACDAAFVALPALSTLAAAIGNTRRIQLKSGWTEPCVIWAAIVAPPGSAKTPCLYAATNPFAELQTRQASTAASELRVAQVYDAAASRSSLTAGPRSVHDTRACSRQQSTTSDVTISGLIELLDLNPRGLLLVRDELAGWIENLNTSRRSDHWLSIYSAGPLVVNRARHNSTHIRRASISICGGFQPEVLKRTLLASKHRENGLAARFLYAVPPTGCPNWSDRNIRPEVVARYSSVLLKLSELTPTRTVSDPFEPLVVRPTREALERFKKFFASSANQQMTLDADLAAMWPKLRACVARLALVIQFAQWAESNAVPPPEIVEVQSFEAAIVLVEWFAGQAKKVLSLPTHSDAEFAIARTLKIARNLGGSLSANDLRRYDRSVSAPRQAECLLNMLVNHGLGEWRNLSPTVRGGRPTRVCVLRDVYEITGGSHKSQVS